MNRWYRALCWLSAAPLVVAVLIGLWAWIAGSGTGSDTGIILLAIFLVVAIVSAGLSFGLMALVLWFARFLQGFAQSLVLIIGWVLIAAITAFAVFRIVGPFFFKSML